ncbi:hypothetical protein niasHS_010391 [Heterodera schachtii]|uniref:Uncharacterized protein n=1 Tax=Heterodera schachtii TaxID=97005 RepID=A0ABD2J3P1_HETSC
MVSELHNFPRMLDGAFTSAVVAPGAPIGIVPLSSGIGGGTDLSPIPTHSAEHRSHGYSRNKLLRVRVMGEQHTWDSAKFSSFPSQLASRGDGDGILPSIGFGGTAMPYELRRFSGIFGGTGANPLAPRPKESLHPSPSPFSASFGTFPCRRCYGRLRGNGGKAKENSIWFKPEHPSTGMRERNTSRRSRSWSRTRRGWHSRTMEIEWRRRCTHGKGPKVGGDGDQNARNGGQYQQLQKMLSLQQRKTVAQMPNGEAEKSGDGAETAPMAAKALEKNKGEEMGRKRRRESNSRRKRRKKKRKEEEEEEEKAEGRRRGGGEGRELEMNK